jgi:hypothetical protein
VLTAYDILILRTNDGIIFYEVNRSKNAAYA